LTAARSPDDLASPADPDADLTATPQQLTRVASFTIFGFIMTVTSQGMKTGLPSHLPVAF
jgi:hypothetical protein